MTENKKIHDEATCLVFCEGRDEEGFFRAFQKWYKDENPLVEGIQFVDCGGNSDMRKGMQAFIGADGFEHIRGVGVIRDAEKDADAAVASIRGILDGLFEEVPKECFCVRDTYLKDLSVSNELLKIGFVILPGYRGEDNKYLNGTLEDLCWQILFKDKTVGQAILDQEEARRGCLFQRRHKNLLHTNFSITDEYVGLKIGEAARSNAFDFQHKFMHPFGEFFNALTKVGDCLCNVDTGKGAY